MIELHPACRVPDHLWPNGRSPRRHVRPLVGPAVGGTSLAEHATDGRGDSAPPSRPRSPRPHARESTCRWRIRWTVAPPQFLLIEQARTPWATDPAQRVGSSGLPFGVPPAYALTRDLKLTHDVGLGLSLTKELSGASAHVVMTIRTGTWWTPIRGGYLCRAIRRRRSPVPRRQNSSDSKVYRLLMSHPAGGLFRTAAIGRNACQFLSCGRICPGEGYSMRGLGGNR